MRRSSRDELPEEILRVFLGVLTELKMKIA